MKSDSDVRKLKKLVIIILFLVTRGFFFFVNLISFVLVKFYRNNIFEEIFDNL